MFLVTEKIANAAFDVLAEHAGAPEYMRDKFVYDLTHGCTEFQVSYDGKLYVGLTGLRFVSFDRERTREGDAAEDATNAALLALGGEPWRWPL